MIFFLVYLTIGGLAIAAALIGAVVALSRAAARGAMADLPARHGRPDEPSPLRT